MSRATFAAHMLAAMTIAATLSACGSARRSEPFVGAAALTPPNDRIALGERVFDRNCSQCHPGGEAGLGPALNDKPLPQFAMHIQVRNGVGAMPRFSSAEISDAELKAVTSYLAWLRGRHRE
jgi:mono/diheme cytochrome c family protein